MNCGCFDYENNIVKSASNYMYDRGVEDYVIWRYGLTQEVL